MEDIVFFFHKPETLGRSDEPPGIPPWTGLIRTAKQASHGNFLLDFAADF